MASNKRILKHYVRYDNSGKIIPGGNILSRVKPKVGDWTETNAYECCNGTATEMRSWLLSNVYAPPSADGIIIFPNHTTNVAELNPNLVGLAAPTGAQLYIYGTNLAGVQQPALAAMAGNSGTLKLTQGTNSVTYAFTAPSFNYNGGAVYYDWAYGPSVRTSLTLQTPATANFDLVTPIFITVTLT